MDTADTAADLQDALNASALADHLARHPTAPPGALGRAHCVDCGEPIPLPRRLAVPRSGRCIDCQLIRDRRLAIGG